MVVADNGSLRSAVEVKGHRIAVGINFGGDDIGEAIRKSVTSDINHRVGGPIGFIIIEGVFADLTIISCEALVIAARGVAFVAAV